MMPVVPHIRRLGRAEHRRPADHLLVEGDIEPPPDLLEDLDEAGRLPRRGRHATSQRRVQVMMPAHQTRACVAAHYAGSITPRWLVMRPVHLGPAVAIEVEQRVLVPLAPVEVAPSNDQLVVGGQRLGDDLSARGDDHRLRQRVDALLDAALGDTDHPGAVLVGAALHDERVVEPLEDVLARIRHVVDRRVVAAQDHLDALQPHHPIASPASAGRCRSSSPSGRRTPARRRTRRARARSSSARRAGTGDPARCARARGCAIFV